MYTLKTFNDPVAFADYLNGVVLGAPLAAKTSGLHGLTLIITTTGDKTVTFADADGAGLSPADILAQIRAADPSLSGVLLRNYGYAPYQPQLACTTAASVVKKTGTANAILGFSTAADATVTEVTSTNIIEVTVQTGAPQYAVLVHT